LSAASSASRCKESALCPVSPDLRLWLSSPATVVANFLLAAKLPPPVTPAASTCPASA
jgi:hypothetical protein